ncbi:hypothetical protein ACLOAV_007167 [Pseudogymnoascus australis]
MTSSSVSSILESLATAGKAFEKNEAGAREALIENSRALVAALETPSEFIQHSFWAEPAMSANIRLAVDVKLFQHLKDAGDTGLSASALCEKTAVDVVLLQRLMRHLVAMYLITCHNGAFYATTLSNGLAQENYQQCISFCYDVGRPSFNGFPEFFKKTEYKSPALGGTDGPFQDAHKTQLPFFKWLLATPLHRQNFDSFMSAYRDGKANWYDPGFYPVFERMITGFDASAGEVLLVDVSGGTGHDVSAFAAQHSPHPGKIVLQDRKPTIASLMASSDEQPFEVQACDYFTPQPIKAARAYFLHSVLHDWGDEDSVRILENLVPALKRGYSRVLLNEIMVSKEKPTLAATI